MKKQLLYTCVIFCWFCFQANAQTDLNFDENIRKKIEQGHRMEDAAGQQDTISSKKSLNTSGDNEVDRTADSQQKDPDVQVQPQTTSQYRRRAPLQMSNEALYWSRHATNAHNRFNSYVTYRDTIIVNPLFMPPLFKKGNVMPVDPISFYQPISLAEKSVDIPLYKPVEVLKRQALKLKLENMAYRHVQYHQPYIFDHTAESLPSETIHFIRQKEDVKIEVEKKELVAEEISAPIKFIPDRRYWISSFESALKFSENYASENWHQGGTGDAILNLFTKNLIQYNYAKERIKFDNKLEINASLYSAPNDSVHRYKVGDDLLRYYGNLGYKVSSKWSYTIEAEFKTKMFSSYQENTKTKQSALFSPYTVNTGIGMKYDLKKGYQRKDRSFALSVNMAPLSYSYMYSVNRDIDLGRHGFKKDDGTGEYEYRLSKFGSTVRADMTCKFNRDVTWKSRFYYFTSYDRILGEFENSLDLAISRYFSTLLYIHLRYDDGVEKVGGKNDYLQINEILSFGFSYKW